MSRLTGSQIWPSGRNTCILRNIRNAIYMRQYARYVALYPSRNYYSPKQLYISKFCQSIIKSRFLSDFFSICKYTCPFGDVTGIIRYSTTIFISSRPCGESFILYSSRFISLTKVSRKWAGARQNVQNDLCAQRRLRSTELRVFAVLLNKGLVLGYPWSTKRRDWSNCTFSTYVCSSFCKNK